MFQFPKKGGTGAVWQGVARLVGDDYIRTTATVKRIAAKDKLVHLSDGSSIGYERLLCTLPLDILAAFVDEAPSGLAATAARLKHSSSHIVGVGIEGQPKTELASKCWMYFPENNCPFYRVTLFSKYSPNNVPDISRHFSLMTETSESTCKAVDRNRLV